MKASLVHVRDPFRPQINRDVHRVARRSRIDTLLRRHGLIAGRGRSMRRLANFVVTVDGGKSYLLADQWARQVEDGQVVSVINVPAGGSALRALAMIAVAALSFYTGGLATAAYGAFAGAAVGAGTTLVGSMLVNAMLPLPKPPTGSTSSQSTNYGIGASGNTAKLLQSIPVLYGRFNVTPDYAAQPYTEFNGTDQTLFALFAITQGDMVVEQINIGDTPIGNFSEATYEVIPPNGQVTLFPDNVVTSDAVQGLELKKPSDGGTYVGPFVANPAGTTTTQLAVDIGYPQGLYRLNKDGKERTANAIWQIEAQQIDDRGNPIGGWSILESRNDWRDDKTTGLFETRRYTVPAGRYQVRAKASEPYKGDGNDVNQIYWSGLRAYLPSQRTYGDITLLAVRIKATNNLNSSTARDINVTGTRKLPVWDGSAWSAPQATSSPAWALADIIRNPTYGRGWPDNRINLPGLLSLAQTWAARGDEFNGVFDTKTSLWDALTSVARVGRAIPMYYAGVIDIIRDAPQTVPTLMLAPHNMISGSFQVQYAFPTQDTPDSVVVTYTDPDTWKTQTVTCALAGSPQVNPKNITLMGCTSRDQAFREGMYMAACNRDQRKTVTCTTEMEGYIPRYGDLISVSHDVPAWGISGEVAGYDPGSGTLTTTEPAQWFVGQNHYVALKARNGSQQGPFQVVRGVDDFHLVIQGLSADQLAGIYVSDGVGEEPTIFQFGPGSSQSQQCLVTKAAPDGTGNVALTLTNYAYSVHVAENDQNVPPPPSGSLLLDQPSAPAVGGVGVKQGDGSQTVWLSVDPVPGAVAYEFQVSYDGGVTWISVGVATSNSIQASIPAGAWIVRARAIGQLGMPGPWNQTPINVSGAPPVLGVVTSLTATGLVMGILVTWQLPNQLNLIGGSATEIWFGATNIRANAQLLGTFALPTNSHTITGLPAGQTLYFWARVKGSDSGNYSAEVGPVSGQSSSDAANILGYLAGQIGKTQLAQDLVSEIDTTSGAVVGQAAELQAHADELSQHAQGITNLQQSDAAQNLTLTQLNTTVGQQGASITNMQQTQATQASQLNSVTVKVNEPMAGSDTSMAGANTRMAGLNSIVIARATADYAQVQMIQTLQAQSAGNSAAVQVNANAIAGVNGKLSASYNIKTQVAANGQVYMAGIAVGVDQSGGTVTSQVLVNAATFAVFDASNAGATGTYPFVITGGQTFINSAFIANGTITNAMIGNVIQSVAVDSKGNPIWKLDKNTGFSMNSVGGDGGIIIDSNGVHITDSSGFSLIDLGRWL